MVGAMRPVCEYLEPFLRGQFERGLPFDIAFESTFEFDPDLIEALDDLNSRRRILPALSATDLSHRARGTGSAFTARRGSQSASQTWPLGLLANNSAPSLTHSEQTVSSTSANSIRNSDH